MKKWHMIIDVEKCEDCNNCFLACKDEHVDNEWPNYTLAQPLHGQRWMNIQRKERGQYPLIDVAYRPTPCMQCDNAPCIKAGNGAITKRPDGIVQIDPRKAKGMKDVAKACPYGALFWNEEAQVPQKCTFCAHLLDDGWKKPRCVQVCPTGALRMEYIEDGAMQTLTNQEGLLPLYPEYGTVPGVYYKNLYRFDRCFIAGSVAIAHKNGTEDCAVGAQVKLYQGSQLVSEGLTDAFGDFKIDRLVPKSGSYKLEVELVGYPKLSQEVELQESVNMGTITLLGK